MTRLSYGNGFQASLSDALLIVRVNPALKRGTKLKRRSAASCCRRFSEEERSIRGEGGEIRIHSTTIPATRRRSSIRTDCRSSLCQTLLSRSTTHMLVQLRSLIVVMDEFNPRLLACARRLHGHVKKSAARHFVSVELPHF